MTDKDFAVSTVTGIPRMGSLNKKPCHLITLEINSGKNKGPSYFIAIDRPDLLNGFIQAKGVFSNLSEEEITKKFSDILTNSPKELILDIMFPWHKICSIKSLVFNANKPQTLIK